MYFESNSSCNWPINLNLSCSVLENSQKIKMENGKSWTTIHVADASRECYLIFNYSMPFL